MLLVGKAIVAFSAWLAAVSLPFTVAIDPGHGGSNRGAATQQTDLYEKHVTLAIARRTAELLAGEPALRVVLCRSTDVLVPIRARVRCANQAGARLFISLHANAAGPTQLPGSQMGFELYLLPAREVDREVARVTLLARDDSEAAWAGHQVREAAKQSLAAARRIEWRLADALGHDRDRGIKQEGATLDVLQGLAMPAVLVEVGFLDHATEGRYLLSETGQRAIAAALAGAITDLQSREQRGLREPMTTAPQPGKRRPPLSAQSQPGEE
jgi:N-acetylmuramoyl-L-alanine amidase